jgi:hypothetical protein
MIKDDEGYDTKRIHPKLFFSFLSHLHLMSQRLVELELYMDTQKRGRVVERKEVETIQQRVRQGPSSHVFLYLRPCNIGRD